MADQAGPIDTDELLRRCLDNHQLMRNVLAKFTSRFGEGLAELYQHAASGDRVRFAEVAHRLRGAAASVAAHALQQSLLRIEQSAGSADSAVLDVELQDLAAHWVRAQAHVETFRLPVRE
jgi:HPt (histidine-containing phosphotransfer) domain-containing protein